MTARSTGDGWLTSEQAARRLGVKQETLYAYVSRGLVRSERIGGTRRSRFHAGDVERHAARSRSGGRAGALEVIIETQLTLLDPAGRLAYRGWDVADALGSATFETIAGWLWTGEAEARHFRADPAGLELAAGLSGGLEGASPVDRWRALLPLLRRLDPLRGDRRAAAVAATGRTMAATLLESLPCLGRDPGPDAPVADRLWPRLTAAPPSGGRIRALDGALLLMADHELAPSTLAARVAASTWADPYLVVDAGLAVLGGPRHGGAAALARRLIAEATRDDGTTSVDLAAEVVGARLAAGERLPGFGHAVYEHVDPRADLLLGLLDDARLTPPAVPAILEVTTARALPFPNVDLALAALAEGADFQTDGVEAVFSLARIVGWLAHAIEEYGHDLRFRTRAAYTGTRPPGWPNPTSIAATERPGSPARPARR